MRQHLGRAIELSFTPTTFIFVPFLIGSILLSILGNAAYEILVKWNMLQGLIWRGWDISAWVIFVSALILLYATFWFIAYFLHLRSGRELRGISERSPEPRRGLILLVSNLELCRAAIKFHAPKLQRVWLICSVGSGGKGTQDLAHTLQTEFRNYCQASPLVLQDVENPQETFKIVREIYRNHLPVDWSTSDVISDFTGMKKPTSIGMIMACIGRERPIQYTPGEYDQQLKAVRPLAPIELSFDWVPTTKISTSNEPSDANRV